MSEQHDTTPGPANEAVRSQPNALRQHLAEWLETHSATDDPDLEGADDLLAHLSLNAYSIHEGSMPHVTAMRVDEYEQDKALMDASTLPMSDCCEIVGRLHRNGFLIARMPELCDDEGCEHFGTPHVCLNAPPATPPSPAQPGAPSKQHGWDRYYNDAPTDLKRKLSLHDFKRMGDLFKAAFPERMPTPAQPGASDGTVREPVYEVFHSGNFHEVSREVYETAVRLRGQDVGRILYWHPPVTPARLADSAVHWHEINPERSVACFEQTRVWLWHRMWQRGVTLGFYNQEHDQWCGLDEAMGWFAVGIPPSHYADFSAPSAPNAALADTAQGGRTDAEDARRYRAIHDPDFEMPTVIRSDGFEILSGDDLDHAIDAAMDRDAAKGEG